MKHKISERFLDETIEFWDKWLNRNKCNFCSRVLDCPDDHRDPEEIENRCDFRWRGLEAEKQC